MITDAILKGFKFLLSLLIGILPHSIGLPIEINNALATMVFQAQKWDALFPIRQLFLILTLTFAFEAAIFTFKSINWIINKFRGSGG